ncbi:gag protease polyprotein [Cucumis melo var. makuwa]|uniref:Gag protease polyprotein n=1 Tax=Cucumis melo var. makuwa TaxID=1194695 RepID=A0A5A7V0I9_CUCMM|nr:gag protease polyprotein [Cucumis melo var. makuwa]
MTVSSLNIGVRLGPIFRSLKVDLLSVDSIEGHNQVSGKGFPTTGPRIEAGNVVIHRGLHVSNVTASCSLCAIGCKELFTNRHRCPDVLYIVVMLMGYVVDWNCMLMDFTILRLGVSFGITGLIRASFGITRLIRASFGITRLIRASFGITKLICASFGITRLICASFGITRLIGVSFGVTRLIRASFGITRLMCKGTARGRPTRGRKDAEMPPRRGARKGGRGGRGRGAGRVQPEVQPVAQATNLAAPVVLDQLLAEAKHLRDFRKYNPRHSMGLWRTPPGLSCDRCTAWWETTKRMLGSDVGQIMWQQFKESFYAKFFSASLRDAKRQEFLNFEQDDMTME